MGLKTYFDFAENDYFYFVSSYNHGEVANIMGAIAQGICEKYLKHLIDEYCSLTDEERNDKHGILRTHSLTRLIKRLKDEKIDAFSIETQKLLRMINGYHHSTRYPGPDTDELGPEDIEDCYEAIKNCRTETIAFIENQKNKNQHIPLEDQIKDASNHAHSTPVNLSKNCETIDLER